MYTLTFTVTLEDGELHASYTLTRDGEAAEKALFTNRYDEKMTEPDTVEIAGNKTWNHGDNPEDKWPDSIVVEVYADGQLAAQRLVTAGDGWQYAFELPKYAEEDVYKRQHGNRPKNQYGTALHCARTVAGHHAAD